MPAFPTQALALCVEGGREGGGREIKIMIDEGHLRDLQAKERRERERTKRALAFKMARGPWGKAFRPFAAALSADSEGSGSVLCVGERQGSDMCLLELGLLRT